MAGLWNFCLQCDTSQALGGEGLTNFGSSLERRGAAASTSGKRAAPLGPDGLEDLVGELFRLHDLDGNGLLSEGELIRINEAISEIHNGYTEKSVRSELKDKYQKLFRDQLDPDGRPVPYGRFREYILRVVGQYDKHAEAQAMIVEQWVAEAHTARLVGDCGAPPPDPVGTKTWQPGAVAPRASPGWLLDCCLVLRPPPATF